MPTRLLGVIFCVGAIAYAQDLEFDVASIRPSSTLQGKGLPSLREDVSTTPDGVLMRNVTVTTAIRWAYKLNSFEIAGPSDLGDKRYDITAKAASAVSEDQIRLMLRSLLAERFKLQFHRQARDLAGYAIVKGKGEPKLTPVEGGGEGSMTGAGMVFDARKMPLSRLADIVSGVLRAPVQDATSLPGNYDFKLDLRPYVAQRAAETPAVGRDAPGMQEALVDLATVAIEDELGLKLESRKVRLDVLVVDQVEKSPSEN